MRRLCRRPGVATALLLLSARGPADGPGPVPRLDEQVVDQRGRARSPRRSPCRDALDELQAEDGAQLFVVFVDRTSKAWPPGSGWRPTHDLSGLGGNDALLAVAVDERDYRFHPARRPTSELSVDEANSARRSGAVEPEFGPQGDWDAGVVAFADILRTGEAPGSGGSDSGGGGAAARRRCDRAGRWWRPHLVSRAQAAEAGGAAAAGAADR